MMATLKSTYRRLLDIVLAERSAVRRFMADALPVTRAGMALDLGAGASPYRLPMQRILPGLQILASDRQERGDIDLAVNACRLPFAAGTFDLVSAFQLLQYTDAASVLSEVRRVLRPGGYCLLVCPFLVAATSPADHWRWTMEGLAAEVSRAGFTPVAQRKIGGPILAATALVVQALSFSRVGWVVARNDRFDAGALLRLGWNLLTSLPLHLLGRICLPLDEALPSTRFYIGSIILARRNDDS